MRDGFIYEFRPIQQHSGRPLDPSYGPSGPRTTLAGPQTSLAGPQTPLAGLSDPSQTPLTGPKTPLAGPQSPLAGPQTPTTGWMDVRTDRIFPHSTGLHPLTLTTLMFTHLDHLIAKRCKTHVMSCQVYQFLFCPFLLPPMFPLFNFEILLYCKMTNSQYTFPFSSLFSHT